MKKLIVIFLLFVSLFVNAGNYEITVWGRNTCGYTTTLRNDLTKAGIKFIYYDVSTNTEQLNAMFLFANEYHLIELGVAYFPIVKVVENNVIHGLVRPSAATILKLTPVKSVEKQEIILYPNPVKDILHITGIVKSYEIFNGQGKMIMQSDKSEIDLSRLPTGIYFLKTDGLNVKFIKQ